MENEYVLYYNGINAQPTRVRALISNGWIYVYDLNSEALVQGFPLKGTTHNKVNDLHYLYLDQQGLMYLEIPDDHPLAGSISVQVADANPYLAQRLMRQKTFMLTVILLGLIAGLYLLLINLVPYIGTKIIGVQQEIELGERLKQSMLDNAAMTGEEIDSSGTKELQAFADKLELSRQYPIHVTLLNSKTVNAFALPGGEIVVYSGILKKIKTPEALAALLAHESSHVNERHTLRSILRNGANALIISLVFSDASGIAGLLANSVRNLNSLSYSRSLESE